jgi:parallel beta-helix repeat protein
MAAIGSWSISTGTIEAASPFTGATLANWEGKLATLTVTNFGDAGAGTLRDQIAAAGTGDLVIFAAPGTVTLTSGDIAWATNNLTLDGNGATVDGNGSDRIFTISASNTTIQNITLQNGSVAGNLDGGAISVADNGALTVLNSTISGNTAGDKGGGIYFGDDGTLTLSNSTVSGNVAVGGDGGGISFQDRATLVIRDSTISGNIAGDTGGDHGGGIYLQSDGNAILTNVTVANNVASGDGGGIALIDRGRLTVVNSTISGNTAGDNGGGIYFDDNGSLTLTNATVSGNTTVDDGGGIHFDDAGVATVNNSTLSGNSAGEEGGGLYLYDNSNLTVNNSTISGNAATLEGGGIYIRDNANATLGNTTIAFNTAGTDGGGIYVRSGTGTINNTLVANNNAGTGPDLSGTFTANSSLILDASGANLGGGSTIIGQDPLLLPLGDYGGPTQTHALQPGSPAINAGNGGLVSSLATDQRGARVFGRVDIGAVEFDVSTAVLEGVLNTAPAEHHWICPILPGFSLEVEGDPEVGESPDGDHITCAAAWDWQPLADWGAPRLPGSFHP